MKKCINGLKLPSWEPVASTEYLDSLEHLIFLLRDSVVDEAIAIRSLLLMEEVSSSAINNFRNVCSTTLMGYFPPGLTKKELSRLAVHENKDLRLAGNKLIHYVLLRLEKNFSKVLQQHRNVVESIIVECACEVIPDFSALYNSRLW